MLASMTGFGRAEYSEEGFSSTVEIKSVNNRYCDISIYLPSSLKSIESGVKEIIQKYIQRGKLNVNIRVEKSDEADIGIETNEKVLRSYLNLLKDTKEIAGITQDVTIEHLLTFRDIFTPREETEEELKKIATVVMKAVDLASQEIATMRQREGDNLKTDFKKRIEQIDEALEKVTTRAKERIPEARKKLTDRITNLVEDDRIDVERLEMEIAVLVDKLDITEEIVRLKSHLELFSESLESEEPVGRKLNFLSQEMNREINTMGSKANDSEIAHAVVSMKEVLENIREQIQNVE
jgi:uncharacterized protein (TIGR00255 family)